MSEAIISVEHLSKRFVITHQERESYSSLRDVLAGNVKKLFKGKEKVTSSVQEDFWALNDLNFEIKRGDRVGIIGRNGAGKSTLLKILSRITEPTSGRITINGRVASLLEVGTGFHPELTGRENIFLNGAILGMSRAEIRGKFDEIVAFAEVEKFLDTPVKRYSSGMYVRLAFAVAAHMEPEILIVDEVLAVGDAQFQKKCLGKMQDVSANEGRTVLFVSHNMGVISQLCNKGILLNKGQIESNGQINDVVDRYINFNGFGDSVYEPNEVYTKGKKNFFTKIYTCDQRNKPKNDFGFDEKITLKFNFTIGELVPNLLIGIGIQDKLMNRISTFLKPIDFFKVQGNTYSGNIELPSGTIAPNMYSFVFVIWVKDVVIYDNLDNVCSIKIHDNGTELAMYEGFDYGHVILKHDWKND
jgi:lipopolysaccharide transport system ATP-binding protein